MLIHPLVPTAGSESLRAHVGPPPVCCPWEAVCVDAGAEGMISITAGA